MRPAEEALLMLRCPLGREVTVLNASEYRMLAERMALQREKGDLTAALLTSMGFPESFSARVAALLEPTPVVRRYLASVPSMTVLTRISPGFPQRLRLLGEECPPALFCLGDVGILQTPCVALVGARELRPENRRFAERIGTLAAEAGLTLVSGGARGADDAAQRACLAAGGRVICFVPDELTRRTPRERVLYISDEGCDCAFSTRRALRRNHYIHALGECVFVAQCEAGRGGSWAGASDNLRRGLSTVYAADDGSPGAAELMRLGALPIPLLPQKLPENRAEQLSIFD